MPIEGRLTSVLAPVLGATLLLCSSATQAQTIQIRVLNARNGKRVPNEKVSLLIKGQRDAWEYKTDSLGDVTVNVTRDAAVFAATEWWVTCRRVTPGVVPFVPVKAILDVGFTAENTCGQAKSETIKGKYVIFARKPTFFEEFSK